MAQSIQSAKLNSIAEIHSFLFNIMVDGVLIVDCTGKIIDCNQALHQRLGYEKGELIGSSVSQLVTPEFAAKVPDRLAKVLKDRQAIFETAHYRKNGSIMPVELNACFVEVQGEGYVVSIVRDISERKKAENELNKLSQAIEQAGEGVMITDPDGTIEYVNPAFTNITGYQPEEAIGQPASILKSGAQAPPVYEKLWQAITEGNTWEGTLIEKRKDGSFYPAMISIAPVSATDGKIINYVSIHKDMSEFKRLENQVLQTQKMEAMGTLIGGIAHDFNNMLATLKANAYLAQMEIDDKQSVTEKLCTIDSLSEHAASVVKQLLTFAKKDIVEMEPVALNSLITEEFKLAKSAIPENISHVLDICQEELVVDADITQLQQAVINLSNNARDAVADTTQPLIEWSLRKYVATDSFIARHPDIRNREFAQISVRDNGCGIDDAHLQAIFDPFFTTKEPGKGTGLGLAMVYGSVERHGGILEVGSEAGTGTVFHIYLPLMNTTADQEHATHPAAIPGQGETILLVDDESDLRGITSRVLNKMSYNIIEASDGEEAIALYRQHRDHIDMVITDIVMPGIGGVELAEEVRGDNRHIPIILATGYDREQVTGNNLQIDNCQIINKPFPYDNLSQLIRNMLPKD